MPWKEVSPMEERLRFVSLAGSGRFEIGKLCSEFGISRKSGYKWLERYREHGSAGLKDRSRAPLRIPGRTDREIEVLIVSERRRHPTWGPKKIAVVLERKHGVERIPATSTIGEILKRNGLIEARGRRPGALQSSGVSCRRPRAAIRFGPAITRDGFIWATEIGATR